MYSSKKKNINENKNNQTLKINKLIKKQIK